MSDTVEHLRQVQTDIRLISGKLGELNAEMKNDLRKSKAGDPHEKVEEWVKIKSEYERRKNVLKFRLNGLEEERGELERKLDQTPVSKASLSHIISQLSAVEAEFTVNGSADAWDKLSAFIDWLEREDQRVSAQPEMTGLGPDYLTAAS